MSKKLILLIFLVLIFTSACNNSNKETLQNNNTELNVSNEIKNDVTELTKENVKEEDDTIIPEGYKNMENQEEVSGLNEDNNYVKKTQDWLMLNYNGKIINISDLENEQTIITEEMFIDETINIEGKDKIESYYICPSGEYILLEFSRDYNKYEDYEIVLYGIDFEHSYKIRYWVLYSMKDQKIVALSEVENNNDIDFVHTIFLRGYYYYISSIDEMRYVEIEGDYEYYNNFNDSLLILSEWLNEYPEKCHFKIYDLVKEKIIKEIEIEPKDGKMYYFSVSQWHKDNYILFTINKTSYKYNVKTDELTELGDDIYNPIVTNDGKHLVYFIGPCPEMYHDRASYDSLDSYEGKIGFYVKNLETNEVTLIDDQIEPSYSNIYPNYSGYFTTTSWKKDNHINSDNNSSEK